MLRNHLALWNDNRHWDPFKEFNRFFEGMVPSEKKNGDKGYFNPLTNVKKTEKGYHLTVDLPGVKKEDVKLEIKDDMLQITGERKVENGGTYHGYFTERFSLPQNLKSENIEAEFKDGVLNILLPEAELVAETKLIEIR